MTTKALLVERNRELRKRNRALIDTMFDKAQDHTQAVRQAHSSMTRKHFKALAEALKDSKASLASCQAVADTLSQYNSRFDRTKFLEACGH